MKIRVVQGDITTVELDAVVNAANSSLLGGGVDVAIHRRGGPAILEACKAIRASQGGCATGEAVITTAGNLPAQYVVHTVGPVWQGGGQNEAQLLTSCYTASLDLCVQNGIRSVAFPNISTGVFGFPKQPAAEIAVAAVNGFGDLAMLSDVVFVCFDAENLSLYKALLH